MPPPLLLSLPVNLMCPAAGPYTGYSLLNPALSFASSWVFNCAWRWSWMYWLAQLTGERGDITTGPAQPISMLQSSVLCSSCVLHEVHCPCGLKCKVHRSHGVHGQAFF